MKPIFFALIMLLGLIAQAGDCRDLFRPKPKLVIGRYAIGEDLVFENTVFDLSDGGGGDILLGGNRIQNFIWDSASDSLRFEILRLIAQFRKEGRRYTLPYVVRGRFEIRSDETNGTGPVFIIDSIEVSDVAG